MNTHTPNLPVPAGAVADDWCFTTGDPKESVRFLTWADFRTDDNARVTVDGVQFGDGRVLRGIKAHDTEDLTAAEARQLARALIAAADRLDELSS
jgi:hypothetical protein